MSGMGYQPAYLVSSSAFLICSLDKRILPRHKILLVLKDKGLIGTNYSLYYAVKLNESQFVNKFVLPYEEVHQVYANDVGFSAKLLT